MRPPDRYRTWKMASLIRNGGDVQPSVIEPNVEIQLSDADGNHYSCKVTEDEIQKIQSDESYRSNFLENLKTTQNPVKVEPAKLLTMTGETMPKIWKKVETDLLVTLRSGQEEAFQNRKIHIDLWKSISDAMAAQGYEVTSSQAANKWKSLKRNYVSYIDKKVDVFPYVNEFQEVYNGQPRINNVKSVVLNSSISSSSMSVRKNPKRARRETPDTSVTDQLEDSDSAEDSDESTVSSKPACHCVHTCKKRRRQPLTNEFDPEPVTSFLKEFVDLQRENIFHQQDYLQKQDESLSRFDRYLTNMLRKQKQK